MTKSKKRIDKKKFDEVKRTLGLGIYKPDYIAKKHGVGVATVYRISKRKNFAAYRKKQQPSMRGGALADLEIRVARLEKQVEEQGDAASLSHLNLMGLADSTRELETRSKAAFGWVLFLGAVWLWVLVRVALYVVAKG